MENFIQKDLEEIGAVDKWIAGVSPRWTWRFGPEVLRTGLLILSVGPVVTGRRLRGAAGPCAPCRQRPGRAGGRRRSSGGREGRWSGCGRRSAGRWPEDSPG